MTAKKIHSKEIHSKKIHSKRFIVKENQVSPNRVKRRPIAKERDQAGEIFKYLDNECCCLGYDLSIFLNSNRLSETVGEELKTVVVVMNLMTALTVFQMHQAFFVDLFFIHPNLFCLAFVLFFCKLFYIIIFIMYSIFNAYVANRLSNAIEWVMLQMLANGFPSFKLISILLVRLERALNA